MTEQIFGGEVDRLEASNGSGHASEEIAEAKKEMVRGLAKREVGQLSFAGEKANRSLGA